MDLVVTTPDADFLTVERVGRVFRPSERRQFLSAVRTKVIPKLDDIIWDWKFNYNSDREEPDEYFDMLQGALRAYKEEFSDDNQAISLLDAGLERIQELVGELHPIDKVSKPTLLSPDDLGIITPPPTRDLFDDIDL